MNKNANRVKNIASGLKIKVKNPASVGTTGKLGSQVTMSKRMKNNVSGLTIAEAGTIIAPKYRMAQ